MRLGVAAVAICFAIVGVSAAQSAAATMNRKPTNIPAQALGSALETLAKERDLQVIYRSDLVQRVQSAGAVGVLSPDEALTKLLAGTGLTYRYLNETTVTILPASPTRGTGSSPSQPSSAPPPASSSQKEAADSGAFLLAQAASGQASSASSVESQQKRTESTDVGVQEVIVTAQKRAEKLLQVPVPVSAVDASGLISSNDVRIQDYYTRVPGFSVSPSPGAGNEQVLSIRGITTGFGTNPTVGVTIDDAPFGSLIGTAGNILPDLDPSDIARIEVLRGPQGTLYGASSMGGLLKFVTVDPSTAGVDGRVEAGTDSVHNGAELGYSLRGAVNFPVSDTAAIRLSGFTREDPGYIDNPVLHVDGVNEARVYGGHLSALWVPSDVLSLKLSALYQHTSSDGTDYAYVLPGLSDLQQNNILRDGYDRSVQAYSATLIAKLGGFYLTSVSGYNSNEFHNSVDSSASLGSLIQLVFPGVTGALLTTPGKAETYSQEVRLSSVGGQFFTWLLGGFYTHGSAPTEQSLLAVDPSTGSVVGSALDADTPKTYDEYAAFGDITFHLNDRVDLQLGGRESHIRQTFSQMLAGPLAPFLGPTVTPQRDSTRNVFTYLLTPEFKISPDFMVYARLASGYRPGVPNISANSAVPPSSEPDKTNDYEIGLKGDFLAHALVVDASAYYIDWKDIQLALTDPVTKLTYQTNGSGAKSEGIELSIDARPWTGMTISGWTALGSAVLTEDIPPSNAAYGLDGDRLPNSSRVSGRLSFEQQLPLAIHVGAAVSYVGDSVGLFTRTAVRQQYPSYTRTDLIAGMRLSSWSVDLYANNIADVRGIIGGGIGTTPSYAFSYIQPRTVGITVTKTF